MKSFLIGACILFSSLAFAGFGGSRGGGGGGYSGGSRSSSFGGSRSYSAPSRSTGTSTFGGSRATPNAPIYRPTPRPAPSAPTHNVTVNHYGSGYGYGYGSGGGFWNYLLLSQLFSRPQPVVVAGGGATGEPVYVQRGASFWDIAFWIIILGTIGGFVYIFFIKD